MSPTDSVQLCIHGSGNSQVVLIAGPIGGAWSFRQVIPALVEGGHRVIVVDPFDPRHAGTAPPTLAALAERWGAALAALDVSQAVLVAHSVSSAIALRIALQEPARVRALVSLEGGIADQVGAGGMRMASALAHLVRLPGGGRLVRHKVAASLRERSFGASWVSDEVVRAYAQPYLRDPSRVVAMMRALGEPGTPGELGRRLPELRVPFVLLLGDAPHPSRPGDAEVEQMRAAAPAMVVEVVAGAGHFLHEEQPAVVAQWVLRAAGNALTVTASRP